MTDLELKKTVEAELSFEPSIDAAEIGVAAGSFTKANPRLWLSHRKALVT
jgi:hypothetical protein